MITITDKDKIFACVALPLALLGLFAYFVHCPMSARLSTLSGRLDELGYAEDIAAESKVLERELERVKLELDAANEEELMIRAKEAALLEERGIKTQNGFAGFIDILSKVDSVRVISVLKQELPSADADDSGAKGLSLLRAANGDAAFSAWTVELETNYLSLVKALALLSEYDYQFVATSLSMEPLRGSDFLRIWRINLFL